MTLLSLRGVTKTYPGPLTVLRDVNLDIDASEDIAVVGPSGSGKTTMLSIMGLLDQPTSGEVWIEGQDTAGLPEAARARLRAEVIGFVFQQFFLLPTLSAVDNVAEGMLYQGLRRTERHRRAMEALERVGLAARSGHRPGQLSGGEQQRVAIARAIAGGPRLLFADEPTGALDQANGHMVIDYLQGIAAAGTTVIVITHDQGLASGFSRRVDLLDGEVVADVRGRPTPGAGAKTTETPPDEAVRETSAAITGSGTTPPVPAPEPPTTRRLASRSPSTRVPSTRVVAPGRTVPAGPATRSGVRHEY